MNRPDGHPAGPQDRERAWAGKALPVCFGFNAAKRYDASISILDIEH